jgi:hypothetical protein
MAVVHMAVKKRTQEEAVGADVIQRRPCSTAMGG